MDKNVTAPRHLTLAEVKAVIAFDQPKLHAELKGTCIQITGRYLLTENGANINPNGPITEFDVEINLPSGFPYGEPEVYEVGGRIPWKPDRHINPDGCCCITVWEHWLVSAGEHSFASFMKGPLHQFFLGQYLFEVTGKWPVGEYSHGRKGLQEAFAETRSCRAA